VSQTYEIMFLIDNNAVRAGWKEAKASMTGLIEKHGGKALAARRWDERRLAYPIRHRRRGTYLLAHAEMPGTAVANLRRELDLTESVLRYLILSVERVPPQELELTKAESAADFRIPEPPPDDVPEAREETEVIEDEDAEKQAAPELELAEEEV
jgi:small subunit ribosomal protein S6